jgi:hypothetical protein
MSLRTQDVSEKLQPEVLTFAVEQGVSAYLPAVLKMTREIFQGATIRVELEDDPEIANDWHIVLMVCAKGMDVAQGLEASGRWHGGLLECCPTTLAHVFRISLDLGE